MIDYLHMHTWQWRGQCDIEWLSYYTCSYELRDKEAPEQLVAHVRRIAAALVRSN